MPDLSPELSLEGAQQILVTSFAAWVQDLGLRVESVSNGRAVLRMPCTERLARIGGTICGQALMSAADTAMVIAMAAQLGEFKPMTTVSLTASFMRPISLGDALITARVIKPGRTLTFGEIEIVSASDGKMAVHATATYAML